MKLHIITVHDAKKLSNLDPLICGPILLDPPFSESNLKFLASPFVHCEVSYATVFEFKKY